MASPTNRRDFLYKTSLASLTILISGKSVLANAFVLDKPNSKILGVQIGAITYSWRSLPSSPEQILQYCLDSNISAIELMGDSIEAYAGKPTNNIVRAPRVAGQPRTISDEQKKQEAAYQQQVAEWRASVSMDAFIKIRKMFHKAGVSIYAFKPDALNAHNTDAEIEYAFNDTLEVLFFETERVMGEEVTPVKFNVIPSKASVTELDARSKLTPFSLKVAFKPD